MSSRHGTMRRFQQGCRCGLCVGAYDDRRKYQRERYHAAKLGPLQHVDVSACRVCGVGVREHSLFELCYEPRVLYSA